MREAGAEGIDGDVDLRRVRSTTDVRRSTLLHGAGRSQPAVGHIILENIELKTTAGAAPVGKAPSKGDALRPIKPTQIVVRSKGMNCVPCRLVRQKHLDA